MDNNDARVLIETFKGYRDLLTPVQGALQDFADTYASMRDEIGKLNNAFGGDVQGKLERIFQSLSKQAGEATDLSSRIEQFIKVTNKYSAEMNKLIDIFVRLGERISAVNELEARAEQAIGMLDEILEEKKKSYNVKELQKTLENYNANVQKVSEFINKDVAGALNENYKTLLTIKAGNENLAKQMLSEQTDLAALLETYSSTSGILKKVVEKNDVNESYIFEILDKWAESRKVKHKK